MPRHAAPSRSPAPLPTPRPDSPPLTTPQPVDVAQHLSPPFRAADAAYTHPGSPDTPPPLPIPPPKFPPLAFHRHDDNDDDDDDDDEADLHASTVSTAAGHTRCPTLPSHPTRFESISRTIKSYTPQSASVIKDAIRTYVPSSVHYISIPSAAPTPPMVSRPLSYGTFSVDQSADPPRPSCPQDMPFDDDYRRRGQDPFSEKAARSAIPPAVASYPAGQLPHVDAITWARWDAASDSGSGRRILILGYSTGIQIWDCSDLGSVTEILNLRCDSNDEWSHEHAGRHIRYTSFVSAAILPSPSPPRATVFDYRQGDSLASYRPLLGILLTIPDSTLPSSSAFFIYSLNNHQIIHKISLPGIASTFESNSHLIVISTTSPPTVHILSSLTYRTLWTISSNSLAAFSPTPNSVSLAARSQISSSSIESPRVSPSAPVFALSNRLLAYASPSPHRRSNDNQHHSQSTTRSTSPPRSGYRSLSNTSSPFGFTQGDLGNAAIKVGGTVLSGMKFLGGIAYEAAKNKIGEGGSELISPINSGRRFFSRSAPTDGRLFAHTTLDDGRRSGEHDKDKVVTPHTTPVIESGYHVTVLDLQSLLLRDHQAVDSPPSPTKVAEFLTSKSQQVVKLAFSKDGCSLISVPENGQVVRVFRIRPMRSGDDRPGDGVRLYDLRRGRTSVSVERLEGSRDGRWVAIGTKNRTVHVFPTNPFGGRPDVAGHLQGKVKNVDELYPMLAEVAPLVRLRPKNAKIDHSAPMSFIFVHSGDVRIPMNLLPPSSSKYVDVTSSPPYHRAHRVGNTQDILVFDPSDGTLSLRRIVCDQRPRDQLGLASVSTTARGVVSRSMPSVGSAGGTTRLSSSPSGATAVSRTSSSSTTPGGGSVPSTSGVPDVVMDLVGYDTTVATWNLQRSRDWEEIRKPVDWVINTPRKRGFGADWLARAELSTCSRSPRILPRSLYLVHQFTFWTLGEDYHALLRQYFFDVRGNKIHVRREVQISVGVGLNATSDRFVEDLGGMHPASSSFDEPLASALAGDLVTDHANSIPTVLPMYPNGISGAQSSLKAPAFIRNSIPIRRIGDGMSEGFGRIRREISSSYQRNKVRSPSLGPKRYGDDAMSVPLEFDEEDEDFLGVSKSVGDAGQAAIATTGISAESGTSGSAIDVAPSTPEAEDIWKGWESREVGQAVEEIEKFDDISVVGFLDEEHQKEVEEVKETVRTERVVGVKVRGKKGKKGKKIH